MPSASERLRERRDDYEPFTPNQMDALADVVEAAEYFDRKGWTEDHDRVADALTALRDALQPEAPRPILPLFDSGDPDNSEKAEAHFSSPPPPEGATALIELPICEECMAGNHIYCLDDGPGTSTECRCTCRDGATARSVYESLPGVPDSAVEPGDFA